MSSLSVPDPGPGAAVVPAGDTGVGCVGCSAPGRLSAAEAAVVIAAIWAVTVLGLAHRPVPAVLVGVCAAAAGALVRLPTALVRLRGCCGHEQGRAQR